MRGMNDNSPARLLIVDDEPFVRDLLSRCDQRHADRGEVKGLAEPFFAVTYAALAYDQTPQKIYQFIWQPGFSTAERVTEVSGRGMGSEMHATVPFVGLTKRESMLGLLPPFQSFGITVGTVRARSRSRRHVR